MNASKSYLLTFKSGIFFQLYGGRSILHICTCLFVISLFSCKDKNRVHPDPVEFTWNFNSDSEGWSGDFAEYPVGEETLYELMFELDTLPLPLDQSKWALKLSGKNINSDLFMFAKKMISGLDPNTVYYISFTIEFASNMPNLPETEESPGQLVFVEAGATSFEPVKLVGENNTYCMNIGKCNPNQEEEELAIIGDFTNDTDQPVYALKSVENEQPFHCVTNDKGELWIVIGIDSGYPATTTVYFNSVKVNLF